MSKISLNENILAIPKNFGNSSEITHNIYGKGKCIGWVQGQCWRIEFESGEVRDFLPSKLFKNCKVK